MSRWAGRVSLVATILASPLGGSTQHVRAPDIAAWNSSNPYYVMVWRSAIQGRKDRYEIRSRVVSRDGQPVGGTAQVIDPGSDGQALQPRIALSPVDGSFAMVWVDRRRSTGGHRGSWSIRVVKLDSQGRPRGHSRRISESSRHRLGDPRIVWGRSSNAYFGVVWREKRRSRIEGRVTRYDGRPRGHVIAISPAFASAPALAANKAGWFVAAWTHPGWNRQAIYLRQFRAQGLRPTHRVPGVGVRGLFEHPRRHVIAHADEPVLGFDYKRLHDVLGWNVQAFSGGQDAGVIATVPLDEVSHERLAKPAIVERDPPGAGAAYELQMFRRDRAPRTDVVWWHIGKDANGCFDLSIQHRLAAPPWHAVGDAPERLSHDEDPSGPDEDGCEPDRNNPAVAGAYTAAPNTLYVWESDPYIVGVVR